MEGPLRDGFALNYHLFHSAFDATFWVDVCSLFELHGMSCFTRHSSYGYIVVDFIFVGFITPGQMVAWWLRLLGAGLQVVWLEEFVLPISFCDAITQIICLN